MARLPYLDPDDLAAEDRDLLARPINLARIAVHSPSGARALMRLGAWIRTESALDPRLREMAILRIGVATRTLYEYAHHLQIGRDSGLSDHDIRAVVGGPDAPGLSDLERLVLRATDEATFGCGISERTFGDLAERLDECRLVELTIIIAFYNAVIRVLGSLDVDLEPEYAPYLDEFPLTEIPPGQQ